MSETTALLGALGILLTALVAAARWVVRIRPEADADSVELAADAIALQRLVAAEVRAAYERLQADRTIDRDEIRDLRLRVTHLESELAARDRRIEDLVALLGSRNPGGE
jgi:hypothetical protein